MKKKDPRKWFYRLLCYCPHCNKYLRKQVKWHRRMHSYRERHLNFMFACNTCRAADDKYFYDKYIKQR